MAAQPRLLSVTGVLPEAFYGRTPDRGGGDIRMTRIPEGSSIPDIGTDGRYCGGRRLREHADSASRTA